MDARAARSRNALRGALLDLIEQKSFDQISIRDITTAAGVSYPVFFRQFATREDLLADVASEEIKTLLTPFLDWQESSALTICRSVQAHRTLWTTLLTAGAASIMRSEFIRVAKETAPSLDKRVNPWLPVGLTAGVIVSGMFEVLAWWLTQPKDYPVEYIARILEVLVFEPAMRPQPFDGAHLFSNVGTSTKPVS